MNIFVEADSIAVDKMSGIGHATLEIIKALDKRLSGMPHRLIVIVPYGKKHRLDKYGFTRRIEIRSLPPGYKYINYALTRISLPLPVDLWYGRGAYIFPNYKTWYVPFSTSVMFLHDIAYKIYPDSVHPKNIKYLEANMPRWIKRASQVVTISESSKIDILQFFPLIKKKLSVLYLGVDQNMYHKRTAEEVVAARKKYGIEKRYFIYVGNIEPRKNIVNLLEGYRKYCSQTKDPAQLVLVGGGGWKNNDILNTVEFLRDAGCNVYKPDVYIEDQDLPALYSGALALTHVSLHEGYGLSLVQAQACGSPIIASDLAVFKETLAARNIRYVPPQDTSKIAAAMSWAHERHSVDEGSGTVKHTWDSTAERLTHLIGII
jgi:glycosyltransferase involved in cell wall biosynthesis